MVCPNCGPENREDARFCDECTTSLIAQNDQDVNLENLLDSGSGFAGRQRETPESLTPLDNTRAGRGRLVMPVGEPRSARLELFRSLRLMNKLWDGDPSFDPTPHLTITDVKLGQRLISAQEALIAWF